MTARRNPTRHLTRATPFRLTELAALGCEERRAYADARLALLGYGSSRRVYLLNSRRVLKLAYGPPKRRCDASQNLTEARVASNAELRDAIARVYVVGPGGAFVVSELVRPFGTRNAEFESRTGLEVSELSAAMREVQNSGLDLDAALTELVARAEITRGVAGRIATSGLARSLARLVLEYDIGAGDLGTTSHYGVTPDQRVVLLDYGFEVGRG